MRPADERSRNGNERTVTTVRMTIQEAAEALGVTVEAVRGRMHRGKYLKEKDDEGRVWVLLSPDQLPNVRGPVLERSIERSGSGPGERSRTDGPNVYKRRDFAAKELVEELRGEVAYLKEIVATRDEELRRKDTIIMQMAQANAALAARVPEELEAPPPSEPRGGPETAPEASEGADAPEARAEPQTATQTEQTTPRRRPWWLRLLGG